MKQPQVIEIPDKGSGLATITGLLMATALVIIAVAVWQIASALSWGCIAISAGISIREACRGLGYLWLMKRRGDADLARAIGDSKAKMIAARNGGAVVVPMQLTDGDE